MPYLFFVSLVLLATPASAETIDASVAVSALISQVASVASVLLFAGLLWVVRRFAGERAAENFKDRLQEAAEFAVAEGFRQLNDRVIPDQIEFKVQNQIIASGTKYVLDQFADSVKAGKISEEAIRKLVASRLGVVLNPEVSERLPATRARKARTN